MRNKTIHMIFLGGPECGAMRVLPGEVPSIRIPIPPENVTWEKEGTPSPLSVPRAYHYVITEDRDHAGRFVYRYVGEQ